MNAELCKQALTKVGNPNVLVNIVSRRVRQLTSAGSGSRPLVANTQNMGFADIALLEIIEGKMEWELQIKPGESAEAAAAAAAAKKRRKS